jgi:hypothetical protein
LKVRDTELQQDIKSTGFYRKDEIHPGRLQDAGEISTAKCQRRWTSCYGFRRRQDRERRAWRRVRHCRWIVVDTRRSLIESVGLTKKDAVKIENDLPAQPKKIDHFRICSSSWPPRLQSPTPTLKSARWRFCSSSILKTGKIPEVSCQKASRIRTLMLRLSAYATTARPEKDPVLTYWSIKKVGGHVAHQISTVVTVQKIVGIDGKRK